MVLNLLLLVLGLVYSSDLTPCLTDGSEYQVSEALFGCSAQWGYSDVNVVTNQEVWIMLIPQNVVNLNLTLTADVDVDILVKDASDMSTTPVPCLIGPQGDCTFQEAGVHSIDHMAKIEYSGDSHEASADNPVHEYVYIDWTDRQLAYTIRAHGAGAALAYYEYEGVIPCPTTGGSCNPCEEYTGCKAPYQAMCDGTSEVACAIPTEEPTHAPTMSQSEIMYRACSQDRIDLEFRLNQALFILEACDDRGISCTHAPTDDPTHAPTALPSLSPTDAPTDEPTLYPTHDPTYSDPTHDPTSRPTGYPSWSPTCDCHDLIPAGQTKWYDSHGEDYDCEWYARDAERFCSDSEHFKDKNGLSSKDACCACRGGSCAVPTNEPTVDPTTPPSDAPTDSPTNTPTVDPSMRPTNDPTLYPTKKPTDEPSNVPTATPTSQAPTKTPSLEPTEDPTKTPTHDPTSAPSLEPTEAPTSAPTQYPSKHPTDMPTEAPTERPTTKAPTSTPTDMPTHNPTDMPTRLPTGDPSKTPTHDPTNRPSSSPTDAPTGDPTRTPSASPSCECKDFKPECPPENPLCDYPSVWVDNYGNGYGCDWYALDAERFCTYDDAHYTNYGFVAKQACCVCGGGSCIEPTMYPSHDPTYIPTMHPVDPTREPTKLPSLAPTKTPSHVPTYTPTRDPSHSPTKTPSQSPLPCGPGNHPTCTDLVPAGEDQWYDKMGKKYTCAWYELDPDRFCEHDGDRYTNFKLVAGQACCVCGGGSCYAPTFEPTVPPTDAPTFEPTMDPTNPPTHKPTDKPTDSPTNNPTDDPTMSPTNNPTDDPTVRPTKKPTRKPTKEPTDSPTGHPTDSPTNEPSTSPTPKPTLSPTADPTPATNPPTDVPTLSPSPQPTEIPTNKPSERPTHKPTNKPTNEPTQEPTNRPTMKPTDAPSFQPTEAPTLKPVCEPCYDLVPADESVWHDSFGDTYTCSFYEIDPWRFCEYDAEVYRWPAIHGFTAKQACCVCGGGSCNQPTNEPTNKPTDGPTNEPTHSPTNPPTGEPTMEPTTKDPTTAPTNKPTARPTHRPTNEPTLPPTDKPTPPPTDSPTDTGTKSPSKTPTPEPTPVCEYQLGVCHEELANMRDTLGCEPVECTETVTTTDTSSATYPASIPLELIDASMVGDVNSYTLDRILATGLIDASVGLKVYDGEFVVPDKDGAYVRTCVAYNAEGGEACDSTDLFCSGGATFGWGPQMANNLVLALQRTDLQHPQCPGGCNDNSWYQEQLAAVGVSDSICVMGNAVYKLEGDGEKTFTCVGLGESEDLCAPSDFVCSGVSAGKITYGFPQNIINTLVYALGEDGSVHPQCPFCCDC